MIDNTKIEKKFLFDLHMGIFKPYAHYDKMCAFRCDRNIIRLVRLLENNGFREITLKGYTYTRKGLRNFNKRFIIDIFPENKEFHITDRLHYYEDCYNTIPNYIKRYDISKKEDKCK